MNTVASAFTVAALLGLAATPVVREAAARAGVARADATRATRRIPRLGGLAIAFAFYAAALCHAAGPRDPLLIAALAGGVPILLLGAYDDFRGADAGTKLLVQVAVALALYAAGLRIEAISLPNDATLGLGQLGLPVTVLWIVGITNAFNLLDGLDGLAAGVGVVAAAALCAVASLAGDIVTAVAMAALSGALVSFLVFNFHPASVFMGDTGSLFIGYIIAVTSLSLCTNDVGAAYPLTPALALGLPLLDTMTALGRRLLRGQHPFQGDREHLHHRLLDSGLDHRAAVLLLYLVAAGLGLFAVVSALGAWPLDALALAGGIGCLVALLRRLHGSRMQASSSRGSLLSRAER